MAEDVLHRAAHVKLGEKAIALVHDEVLHLGEVELLALHEIKHAAGGADDDVGLVVLEGGDGGVDVNTSVEHTGADVGKVLGEALVLSLDLVGQLAGVAEHNHMHLAIDGLQLVQCGEHEDGGLAHAGLGLADDVASEHSLGNALVLD